MHALLRNRHSVIKSLQRRHMSAMASQIASNSTARAIKFLLLFIPDQLTITQHCIKWPHAVEGTSHCSNQWRRVRWCRYSPSNLYRLILHWCYNERDGVSNNQPHDCLLNRLFRCRSKKTSKLRVTGLFEGNSPLTDEFPAQRASTAENVSIWWRHHVKHQTQESINHFWSDMALFRWVL